LLGRAATPFVQRALSLDRTARTVVFEAPAGASLAESKPPLPAAELMRVLKRLARGAAAIHILGGSHGAIALGTVVLDDGAVPTIMAAGLGPVTPSQPLDDVNALIAVCAAIVDCEPTFAALAADVCEEVGAVVPGYPTPTDGESLYAAADIVDIAVLAALGSK
jgi:hypothetical protein